MNSAAKVFAKDGYTVRLLSHIVSRIWDKLVVVFGVLCVLLPTSPLNMPLTRRDSGVFLYVGWRILNGEIPYQEIWDHKPPIIFYVNALGLAISNNSRWGVWLIELVSLFLATYIGFILVRKVLGPSSAIVSSFLWLLTLVFVIEGGNLTEEFALPLQFVCLWLAYDFEKSRFPRWRLFLIGLLSGIAFFTKQTTIGIGIAIVMYLVLRRISSGQAKLLLRELLMVVAGGLTVFVVIAAFFSLQAALQQFWSAAFTYNFAAYLSSSGPIMSRLNPVVAGIAPLTRVGLFQFSLIGYIIGLMLILYRRELTRNWLPLLSIGLIDLPIELILVSLSGRTYAHYYVSILPILSLFSALVFWTLLSQVSHWGISSVAKGLFTISVIGIFSWSSYTSYMDQVRALRSFNNTTRITYITASTSPEDTVLLWGAEAGTNYYSRRRSPTRYVYQYPLYDPNYATEQMIEEFIGDIVRNRPRLIIDTKNPGTPIFDFPIQTEAIQTGIGYLRSHYLTKDTIGSWTVYEYADDESDH